MSFLKNTFFLKSIQTGPKIRCWSTFSSQCSAGDHAWTGQFDSREYGNEKTDEARTEEAS